MKSIESKDAVECKRCVGVGALSYQRNDGYEGWYICQRCQGTGLENTSTNQNISMRSTTL